METDKPVVQNSSPEIEELRKHVSRQTELRRKYNAQEVAKAIRDGKRFMTYQCVNGVKPTVSLEIQRLTLILEAIDSQE